MREHAMAASSPLALSVSEELKEEGDRGIPVDPVPAHVVGQGQADDGGKAEEGMTGRGREEALLGPPAGVGAIADGEGSGGGQEREGTGGERGETIHEAVLDEQMTTEAGRGEDRSQGVGEMGVGGQQLQLRYEGVDDGEEVGVEALEGAGGGGGVAVSHCPPVIGRVAMMVLQVQKQRCYVCFEREVRCW